MAAGSVCLWGGGGEGCGEGGKGASGREAGKEGEEGGAVKLRIGRGHD